MHSLNKPSILITGSSRGIGKAIAKVCNQNGFEVILHGRCKTKRLQALAEELNSSIVCFDVTKESEIKNAFLKLSKLDILINCAGVNISKPFNELTMEDWGLIYSVNVFGLANVIKYSYQLLKKSSPSKIINISSIKGTYSAVGRAAYASSKAAVINLTASLAKEFAPDILVNCVSPGFTNTEMTEKTWSERIKNQVDTILLDRIADPKEIAEVVLFLCGDKCKYITGQNIIVDGGFSIKNV